VQLVGFIIRGKKQMYYEYPFTSTLQGFVKQIY